MTASRIAELEAALKPFALIADMEERVEAGMSVMVNVSRCRDARAALSAPAAPEGARSLSAETVKTICREMGSALFDELVSRGVDAELVVQAVEACADRSEAEVAAIRAKEEGHG